MTALTASQIAASNGASTVASTGTSSGNALAQLSSNYNDFLTLLTTQLKNQDPSSPMDSSQFTEELVEFSGVEQQINTNSNLSQLVSITSAGNIASASSMLGATITANASQLPLQNGSAVLNYTPSSAGEVNIEITNSTGQDLYDTTVNASAGANTFTWDGTDASGTTLPDGAYNVSVSNDVNGTAASVPFSVVGTATSLDAQNNNITLNLGDVAIPFGSITSVNRTTS